MRPLVTAMADYDANNHVLYTLLARLSTGALGASDLSLRLPALAGAALFYASLYGLILRLAGPTWWLLLGVATIGANTYVTDLLPLARGYGLAMALFTLALWMLVLETPRPRLAGGALGLAVAANLTFAFPVAGLVAGLVWLDRLTAIRTTLAWAAGVAAPLLAAPMWHARGEHFYFGGDSLITSAGTLMGVSLMRDRDDRSLPVLTAMVVMALTLGATMIVGLRRRGPLRLLATSIGLGLALLALAHLAVRLPYPFGRTGISWLLLFGVSFVALAAQFRTAALALTPLALAALVFYAKAWSTAATAEWEWDAGTRAIAELIARQPKPADGHLVRIGSSPLMFHTLNYYRRTRGWTWMEDVKPDDFRQGHYDYYVLTSEDRQWAETQGMKVLYEHPAAHSFLARRND
jgi:hypothetical protein